MHSLHAEEHLLKSDLEGHIKEKGYIKNPILGDSSKILEEEHHLRMSLSYMAIAQYEVINSESASGDRADFVMHYVPLSSLSFGLKIEMQNQYGSYSSSEFKDVIGSLNKVSPGYSEISLYIKELWSEYKFTQLDVRFGIINTNSFVDKSFYNNFTKFTMSHASSSQSFGNIPLSSLGIGFKYIEKEYSISGVMSDATQKLEDALYDIKHNDLSPYTTLEFALTPEKNIYFINVWSKKDKANQYSYGSYISLNQYLSKKNKLFLKYGINNNTTIKQHFSIGWSQDSLLDNNDLFISSFSSSQQEGTKEIQNALELLYKYKFDNGIELSGDLQIIQNSMLDNQDWAIVPSIRLKTII